MMSSAHPRADPFLHALFAGDDAAVSFAEVPARVGFLVAELDRRRGWSGDGQIDRRVQSVFTWSFAIDVGHAVTTMRTYLFLIFVAEAAYYYARVRETGIDALRRTAAALVKSPFLPGDLRQMHAVLQTMAPGSDNAEAQRSLVELLVFTDDEAVSRYLPVTKQIAQGSWEGGLGPNLRRAMQEITVQLAEFDA